MALIACNECKAQIPDAASIRPQCGVTHPELTGTGQVTILRQDRFTGSLYPARVIVDGEQAGELRDGGRLTLDLAQGAHAVEVACGGLSRRLEVSVVEGAVLRYTMYLSPWGVLGGGIQLVPESEAPQPLSVPSIRKSAGIIVGSAVVVGVIVWVVMSELRPGSEFVGKWVNTNDPAQTVTIVRGPDDTSGMGWTYFQLRFSNGAVSQATLDSGCTYCPKCSCIGESIRWGSDVPTWGQEWDYDKNSDTLFASSGREQTFTYRRAN